MKKEMKEAHKQKIVSEIIAHIKKHGSENGDMIFWNTNPVCVKDICVNIVALPKTNDVILFGDLKNGSFISFRNSEDLDYVWLADVLGDMKAADRK